MQKFIDEPVEVQLAGDPPIPKAFRYRGEDFPVLKLVRTWSDWHFGAGAKTRNWRTRRHRNYYRVLTASGEFDLYLDRGVAGEPRWILYQQVAAAEAPGREQFPS
jgi:hypothetical protein